MSRALPITASATSRSADFRARRPPIRIRGRVVHTAVEQTGSFACSKPVLNGLQRIIVWGQTSNLHGIPTDCCQRDERMGWMGDAQGTAEEAIYNFDMAAFYTNFLRDIRDVQDDKGTITDTVPHVWGIASGRPGLGNGLSSHLLVCLPVLRRHADPRRALRRRQEIRRIPEDQGRERPGQVFLLRGLGVRGQDAGEHRFVVLLLL